MAKDTYWGSVVLAMHMDGGDNSQVFTDLKGKVITVNGNTKIVTAEKANLLGNTSSAYFDGSGDYLTIPNSTEFDWPGDFTVEMWYRPEVSGTGQILFDSEGSNASQYGFWLSKAPNNLLSAIIMPANAANKSDYPSNIILTTTTQLVAGSWYWIQVRRIGTQFGLAINGVEEATGTLTTATGVYNPGTAKWIGARNSSTMFLQGWLDDIRITKGVGRPYGLPTEPFPNGGYEVGGTVLDSNASPVARTLRVYRRDTGALLGSGVSNPVTGVYNIAVDFDQEVNVVMLDDALGTLENDQILRTTPV